MIFIYRAIFIYLIPPSKNGFSFIAVILAIQSISLVDVIDFLLFLYIISVILLLKINKLKIIKNSTYIIPFNFDFNLGLLNK